jgi:hypothetical protein
MDCLPNATVARAARLLSPFSSKTITSAAEARKVAQLCGHHLDHLRVLAMTSVVRLNG